MEIVENKLLVFKTRHPHRYSLIPKSKAVPRATGGYDVAVYWGLDEVRVLRNLGVKDVPSPIYGRYDWPGRYTPMAHQKETALLWMIELPISCIQAVCMIDSGHRIRQRRTSPRFIR